MYRQTAPSQADVLSNFESYLSAGKRETLHDRSAWHNVFFTHLVSRINEDRFAPLFDDTRGRPNASIRMLVGMIFLKEGRNWSDAELFEQCKFNILVLRALGLSNLDEEVPAASTYYLFRQQLFEYESQHGEDLIGQTFKEVTRDQANQFGVNADYTRMDSKLFGSNIANCCRLQLVVGCLRVFWKSLSRDQRQRASDPDRAVLDELLDKKPHHVVYGLKEAEKATRLQEFGGLISRLLDVYSESDSDHLGSIERVFREQYNVVEKKIVVKEPKKVASSSLQSPHDPDATFRKKQGRKTKGYTANVTETCNPQGLNLITDIQIAEANKSDTEFVVTAIENTEAVVGEVQEVSMDGAYNSPDNTTYAANNGKTFHFGGMQGTEPRFAYEPTDDGIVVTDTKTGETQVAEKTRSGKSYRASFDKPHYFREEQVQNFQRRKQIQEMPYEVRCRRNNVEATVFHLSHLLRQGNTRYRGAPRNRLWGICRAAWVNLVRIGNNMATQLAPAA